ncbi:GNAT family N-acetyltransferase [Halobacillus naozhouensis]|uniref:GNAT family N-acetyltransferase n=1 Tax=Halobacillus naozhouensis TaxID=554880 RepID=A0ABY8J1L0_9BACI|nr:GNAT family N-acetyltransferase [Halobacillus naozhouensis]WFT74660.1 GNAT family N-acetyltransferase [Halobacillus naozhouensis]
MESPIKLLLVQARQDYLPYLLLADETVEIINEYINDGELYAIVYNQQTIGVCLFTFPTPYTVEVKNFAIQPENQGQGLGKRVMSCAFQLYKERGFEDMVVGTANSSIANLAFYQKTGFRMDGIIKDFFARYPEPLYEDGIRALDMIRFRRKLIYERKLDRSIK